MARRGRAPAAGAGPAAAASPSSEEGIDEGGDGRALGEDDHAAAQQQHEHHRDHPPELHFPEKAQELAGNREPHQDGLDHARPPFFSTMCSPTTSMSMPLREKVL